MLFCLQIVDEDGKPTSYPACGASPAPLTRCLSGLGDSPVACVSRSLSVRETTPAPVGRTLSVREESPVGAKRTLSDMEPASLDAEASSKKLDAKPDSAE